MLTRKAIYTKITTEKPNKKLLKIPYFKVAAVIFIVSAFALVAKAMSGSFDSATYDQEAVREESFLYASEYLNPTGTIIDESYINFDSVDEPKIMLSGSAFVAANSPSDASSFSASARGGIITYEVQPGDVLSEIAANFGITTNTLLWANNLSYQSTIKPGQKLIILPVSGIKYTIKNGDTLDKIVKTYKGNLEKTITINALPASKTLVAGEEIIIFDGQKPVSATSSRALASYKPEDLGPYGNTSHKFPWGQCTWYIAQKRYIPWGGNANTWLKQAIAYGFPTGTDPQVGAVMITRENRYYGHVAYVEVINGDNVTVSEMSLGNGIKRVRTLDKGDWRILGYIY